MTHKLLFSTFKLKLGIICECAKVAAAVPHGGVTSTSVVPVGRLASVGGQKGPAWVQPFPLCDFRSPSHVTQSFSVQTGERLQLEGRFSANHVLRGARGQTILALYK